MSVMSETATPRPKNPHPPGPKLPPPAIPHVYVEKGLGTSKVEAR